MRGARPDTWMPIYWGDYLRDTCHLSAIEHGAYLLIIAHYWTKGGPLKDDDARLARIARLTPEEWKEAKETISDFFSIRNGLWTHKRVDHELANAKRITEAKAKAGQKGAQSRWQGHSKKEAEPSSSQWQNDAPSQPHIKDPVSNKKLETGASALSSSKLIYDLGKHLLAQADSPPKKPGGLITKWL